MASVKGSGKVHAESACKKMPRSMRTCQRCHKPSFAVSQRQAPPSLKKHFEREEKHPEEVGGEEAPKSRDSRGPHTPITAGLFLFGAKEEGCWRFNKLVTCGERKRECQRRRGEMPPDRRSSGKQKRLHTLLRLICLRVLSTAGSVSVTPFPPSLLAALPPPHPSISSPPPLFPPFAACHGPCYQARADVRGPIGA